MINGILVSLLAGTENTGVAKCDLLLGGWLLSKREKYMGLGRWRVDLENNFFFGYQT